MHSHLVFASVICNFNTLYLDNEDLFQIFLQIVII